MDEVFIQTNDSCCSINKRIHMLNFSKKEKLIILDDRTMINKFCFEALDKCLRDILRFSTSFNPNVPLLWTCSCSRR